MRHHTQHERVLRQRTSPYIDAHRCTALYSRLMQAMLGPKHASNLTNVIPHDKFQPCHWPLLAYVALHVLRCVLLEIALNASSVVLEGAAAFGDRTPRRVAPRRAFGLDTSRVSRLNAQHVGPFYGVSVYSCSLLVTTYGSFIRRSTCGSYRIAIFCLISYRIYRFLLWLYRAITSFI